MAVGGTVLVATGSGGDVADETSAAVGEGGATVGEGATVMDWPKIDDGGAVGSISPVQADNRRPRRRTNDNRFPIAYLLTTPILPGRPAGTAHARQI